MPSFKFKGDEKACEVCHENEPKHKMWCKDCAKVHLICEYCYTVGKKEGIVVDYKGDAKRLDPDVARELK